MFDQVLKLALILALLIVWGIAVRFTVYARAKEVLGNPRAAAFFSQGLFLISSFLVWGIAMENRIFGLLYAWIVILFNSVSANSSFTRS